MISAAQRHTILRLSLSVEVDNPARRLYRRLGFNDVDTVDGSVTRCSRCSALRVPYRRILAHRRVAAGTARPVDPSSIRSSRSVKHQVESDKIPAAGSDDRRVRGGTLRRTIFQPYWRKGREAAGLAESFRFHDLRHTGNTWAAATGANLRELMERMGHSSTRAALIYLHAAREGDRSTAAGIDRRLIGSGDDENKDDGDDRV